MQQRLIFNLGKNSKFLGKYEEGLRYNLPELTIRRNGLC